MKKTTGYFMGILVSGLMMLGMTTAYRVQPGRVVPEFAVKESTVSEVRQEQVPLSADMLDPHMISPDEIDAEGVLFAHSSRFMQAVGDEAEENEGDAEETTASESAESTTASTPSSTAQATTTTAKAPEDESKNTNFIAEPNYQSPYYIVVYTGSQSAVVYGKDSSGAYNQIVKTFTVSTGRKSSTPTRKGVYKIRAKYRWRKLMGGVYGQYSSSISPNYLFHSVPYASQSVSDMYNASYDNLGRDVSHGCIRMCVRDCKWIYDHCPIGTQVHVVWASGPSGSGVPKRKSGSKYSGWDPSDQWAKGNPYFADGKTTADTVMTTTASTTTTTTTTTTSATTAETAETTASVTETTATTASKPATTASATSTEAKTSATTATSKMSAASSTANASSSSESTKSTAQTSDTSRDETESTSAAA